MNQEFEAMSVSQLRAYILAHREDETAFHALVDRLTINSSSETYPYPNTPKAIAIVREAIRSKLGKSG